MSLDAKKNTLSGEYLSKHFIQQILITILQESLDKLFVLKRINNWPDNQNRVGELISLEDKIKSNTCIVEEKGVNKVSSIKEPIFDDKCIFVESMLNILLQELTTKGSYEEFERTVNDFKSFKSKKTALEEKTAQKEAELEKLRNTDHEERLSYYEKISNCMTEIGKLKDEIEDFRTESEAKHNFVLGWQNSKIEMNEIIALGKQNKKVEEIEHTNIELNREERIHIEILCAYEEFEKDITVKLEEWKVKYQIDLGEINKKLDVLRDKYNSEVEKIHKRRELFNKREKEITEYKEYKIQQERIKAEIKRKEQGAIQIQAWWRGVMVRKGFGKFKKKRDKKLKKKSSEKKIEIPEMILKV